MKIIIFILIISPSFSMAQICSPQELFIRAQHVHQYTKKDDTHVREHNRKSHCRLLNSENYFQDKTSQKFKNIKPEVKPWTPKEKDLVDKILKEIPGWLKTFTINELLRAKGSQRNPAHTIPETHTLVIYDSFFAYPNKKDILIHEVAHISILDLTEDELIEFYTVSGWQKIKDKSFIQPEKLLIEVSNESISEDYANHIEVFYSNPEKLKKFNLKTFQFINSLITKRLK